MNMYFVSRVRSDGSVPIHVKTAACTIKKKSQHVTKDIFLAQCELFVP